MKHTFLLMLRVFTITPGIPIPEMWADAFSA